MTAPSDTYHDWKVKLVNEGRAFDVPAWWSRLRSVTFPAAFVPLPLEAARACIAQYQHSFCSRPAPGPDHVAALRHLCDAIDAGLREAGAGAGAGAGAAPSRPGRFFVRLSSRSPKDAGTVSREAHEARVRYHLSRLEQGEGAGTAGPGAADEDGEVNARLLAMFDVTWACLAVDDAPSALALLLASERVFADLLTAVEAVELYNMQIIVRPWSHRLLQHLELRGFVCAHTLTAISQYNQYCCFPHFADEGRTGALMARVREYWRERVRPLLLPQEGTEAEGADSYADYVVDFGVLCAEDAPPGDPRGEDFVVQAAMERGPIVVIELNPFLPSTGPALYHWVADAEALRQGPFSYRVATKPVHGLKDFLEHCEEEMLAAGTKGCPPLPWELPRASGDGALAEPTCASSPREAAKDRGRCSLS